MRMPLRFTRVRHSWFVALAVALLPLSLVAEPRTMNAQAGSRSQRATKSTGLRAAAVKVDITPETPQWLLGYQARQSTGVHDRIYHRVVALDAGATQLYLI